MLKPFRYLHPYRDPFAAELADLFGDWREAEAAVQTTYARWNALRGRDRRLGFAGYLAALDQEQRAARAYAAVLRRRRTRRDARRPLSAQVVAAPLKTR
jgi:hypothetical protein